MNLLKVFGLLPDLDWRSMVEMVGSLAECYRRLLAILSVVLVPVFMELATIQTGV